MTESIESKPTEEVTSAAAVPEDTPDESEIKNVTEATVPAIKSSSNDVAELSEQLKEEMKLEEETRSKEDPDEVKALLILFLKHLVSVACYVFRLK